MIPPAFARHVAPGEAVTVTETPAPAPLFNPKAARIKPGDWWARRVPGGWTLRAWT